MSKMEDTLNNELGRRTYRSEPRHFTMSRSSLLPTSSKSSTDPFEKPGLYVSARVRSRPPIRHTPIWEEMQPPPTVERPSAYDILMGKPKQKLTERGDVVSRLYVEALVNAGGSGSSMPPQFNADRESDWRLASRPDRLVGFMSDPSAASSPLAEAVRLDNVRNRMGDSDKGGWPRNKTRRRGQRSSGYFTDTHYSPDFLQEARSIRDMIKD